MGILVIAALVGLGSLAVAKLIHRLLGGRKGERR